MITRHTYHPLEINKMLSKHFNGDNVSLIRFTDGNRIKYNNNSKVDTFTTILPSLPLQGFVMLDDIVDKSIKLYSVLDDDNFMDDTINEPLSELALRQRFWDLEDARTEKFDDFTFDYIKEMWQLNIVEFESDEYFDELNVNFLNDFYDN